MLKLKDHTMRWDDYRQSENLEDRRGGGGNFAGLPGGRGGIGIGTMVVLGLLGWALGIAGAGNSGTALAALFAPGLAQVQLVGQPVGCYIFSSYTRPIYRRLQPF